MSVTLHDVAPATQARCERLIADLSRVRPVPLTLLIVPFYHRRHSTTAFEQWIETRVRRGDELALHGLTHLDEAPVTSNVLERVRRRWYTAGEGEFAALDSDEATERIEAGRHWFARRGWPLRGFVAPAWLLGAGAWQALDHQPFDYTCTLRHLIALRPGGPGDPSLSSRPALPAWSIVFSTRSAWRRRLSMLWNGALVRRQRRLPWMRFELHPTDAEHPAVREAMQEWIARAAEEEREPLTLGAVADRLRSAGDVS